MKNILKFGIATIIIILSFSCEASDTETSNTEKKDGDTNAVEKNNTEYSIIGKWKLIESYISSGGPQYLVKIENGTELEFFENSTFLSNESSICSRGTFKIEFNELMLDYECNELGDFENLDGFITYQITIERDSFSLIPTSIICTEGCTYIYKKLE